MLFFLYWHFVVLEILAALRLLLNYIKFYGYREFNSEYCTM